MIEEEVKEDIKDEDRRTTLHGIKQADIDWLRPWYEQYSAKLTPEGWQVGDTRWLDMLQNSVRQ